MILRALKRIHKDQRGFTLIEVLVVMTILGILAAIVSISLLGVTASARKNAKNAERQTVQAAFDAMLSDQQVPSSPAIIGALCNATGDGKGNWVSGSTTKDMTNFPGSGSSGGSTNLYKTSTTPSGLPTQLSTHYLREQTTQYDYGCTDTGDVVQK
jgi:prepilin-type N-terminal cleavage/methylation domain-containing protein